MLAKRAFFGAVAVNGRIYAVGGRSAAGIDESVVETTWPLADGDRVGAGILLESVPAPGGIGPFVEEHDQLTVGAAARIHRKHEIVLAISIDVQ